MPEAAILGNVLYHNHQIIASAKQSAAEAFLESARFAGALGDDQVFRPDGPPTAAGPAPPPAAAPPRRAAAAPARRARRAPADVRIDLRLWDADEGKTIRVRAPQSITAASFERFLQAFRLLVRVEEPTAADAEPADRAVGGLPPGRPPGLGVASPAAVGEPSGRPRLERDGSRDVIARRRRGRDRRRPPVGRAAALGDGRRSSSCSR